MTEAAGTVEVGMVEEEVVAAATAAVAAVASAVVAVAAAEVKQVDWQAGLAA